MLGRRPEWVPAVARSTGQSSNRALSPQEARTISQTGGGAQRRRKPLDRDHQHAGLDMLDSTASSEAHDRQRTALAPSPPATGQPFGLLEHTSNVPILEGLGFGLDYFLPRRGALVGFPTAYGPGVHVHLTCSGMDGTHVGTTYKRNE